MKNITFFVNQSLESPNGVGRYFPIAKELVKKGHSVTIIALHHNFRELKERSFVKDGVKVCYVGQMHVLKIGDNKIYFKGLRLLMTILSSTLSMCAKGLSIKSDFVYLFKPQPVSGTAAFLTSIFRGSKLIVDCDDYEAESNKFSSGIQKRAFAFFEDNLPKRAYRITVHNSFLQERLIGLGLSRNKIVFLPNGLEKDRFSNVDNDKLKSLGKKLNLKNQKVVLYFGTISLKSGHSVDLLLKSFPIVKKSVKNALLLLVGGGEDIDKLKEYVKSNGLSPVIFVGRVDAAEIPYYLRLSDVAVDPVYDTPVNRARCPLKIFESMASGVPVVTGDVGDRRLFCSDGAAGVLVKPGDYGALAQGIISVLNDRALHARISKQGLKASLDYSWDKLVDRVIGIIEG